MRAIWTGSISFGLVNIPVRLYSAVEKRTLDMHMRHQEDNGAIKFKRVCEDCEEEVAWGDIVKGLEVKKNQFITISQDELKAIKPERSRRIEIQEFVEAEQLDPIYFESHYYLGPDEAKEKTYFLFHEALKKTGKVAIGMFVMRNKEYVVAVRPHGEGILLTTMNYAYEIRDINKLEDLKSKPKISKAELDLAEQLIDKITQKKFNLSKFEDNYADELKKLVAKKMKGEKIIVVEPKIKKTTEKNLIEALKASL